MRTERFAGKDCLAKHYAKLMRTGQLCPKGAEESGAASLQGLTLYTLEASLWYLRHLGMAGFTGGWLGRQAPLFTSRREMTTRFR